MSFNLATAKERLGISSTDTSKDATITRCIDSAKATAERYCDRKLFSGTQTDEFFYFDGSRIQLTRYPVQLGTLVITAVDDDTMPVDMGKYKIDINHGRILLKNNKAAAEVRIDYMAGYDVNNLPPDLEYALFGIFDTMYAQTVTKTSVVSSAPAGVASITVPDVGTVNFDTGNSVSPIQSATLQAAYGVFLTYLDYFRANHVL